LGGREGIQNPIIKSSEDLLRRSGCASAEPYPASEQRNLTRSGGVAGKGKQWQEQETKF